MRMIWQKIDTAQTEDGLIVLGYWPTMSFYQYPALIRFDAYSSVKPGWEMLSDREFGEVFPTNWMPLPPPPTNLRRE